MREETVTELPASDPDQPVGFTPEVLDRTVLSIPLLKKLQEERDEGRRDVHAVVIDVNLMYADGRDPARERAKELIRHAIHQVGKQPNQGINEVKSNYSEQYLFARLEGDVLRRLVVLDDEPAADHQAASRSQQRAIYRIWPDFPVKQLGVTSISTVKADAAHAAFAAAGEEIVWAVVDSGIDATHPHFRTCGTLELPPAIEPVDFTGTGHPLEDELGHGTHVAGILAGELRPGAELRPPVTAPDRQAGGDGAAGTEGTDVEKAPGVRAFTRHRDQEGEIDYEVLDLDSMTGIAPKCKLLSLKVLDKDGRGNASDLIAALEHIQRINGNGRRLLVHGVNMSVGYDFEPEWFACGQSPLCVEVDRLVRSGVVVVVAAGNTGYGYHQVEGRATAAPAGLDLTINDPGNAELAITVGATHRDMPHVYGVSYFSSKGPTGDGRLKPDLVAPGEKILSCAAGRKYEEAKERGSDCNYLEDSGTSMAAPHVSGAIAAFLSVRREFIGRPEAVKEIFLSSATDLRRDRNFQGAGLVDLMRAIQSV
ncbi:S8 family peptidase [Geodermatophilus sp. URMC 62]|uniref:S8 family peptidase n=1 Tax=Geodermatophilus sp. URMC 62 TaxID=3423414 RepID=UPI00406CAF72